MCISLHLGIKRWWFLQLSLCALSHDNIPYNNTVQSTDKVKHPRIYLFSLQDLDFFCDELRSIFTFRKSLVYIANFAKTEVLSGHEIFETDEWATTFVVCDRRKFRNKCYIVFDVVDNDNVWNHIVCREHVGLFFSFTY